MKLSLSLAQGIIISRNRKPSSQLRSRSGVGEATQSGCGAEVRRGWAGEGGGNASYAGDRERRRQATKARVDRGDGPLDLDVGVGRGDFDLDEAELVEAELDAGRWTQERGSQGAGRGGRGRGAQSGGHASTTRNQDWGRSSCAQREEPIVDWARRAGAGRR